MANMTIYQHKRRLKTLTRLHDHMKDVYLRNPSEPYKKSMDRLCREISSYAQQIIDAQNEEIEFFERDPFEVWPKVKEPNLSRGRAGDVDPGGAMTKQQCGRGVHIVGGMRYSVSNGEW